MVARLWKAALISTVIVSFAALGCETGATRKHHPGWLLVSDVTTTAPPNAHSPTAGSTPDAEALTGQPPVPGSPTASNADGTQPPEDQMARPSPAEEEGSAPAPRAQPNAPVQ